MKWYWKVLKTYAVFSGRAQRAEFWYFLLFDLIVAFVLNMIDHAIGDPGVLSLLYGLALVIPRLALFVRRLHDTNHSAWWILIPFLPLIGTILYGMNQSAWWILILFIFIPLIGMIVIFLFLIEDSQFGENEYGPNPKEEKISLPEER